MSKVPNFRRTVGKATAEMLAADIENWAKPLAFLLSGQMEFPDLKVGGTVVPGNLRAWPTEVKFTAADTDTFVAHQLGFSARMWIRCGGDSYHQVRDGSKPPGKNGLWLRSDLGGASDPVTERFLIFGTDGKS